MIKKFTVLLILAASAACDARNPQGTIAEPELQPPPPEDVPVVVMPPIDAPIDAPPEAPMRDRQRMDLDQLNAAIRRVTGGIGWTEQRGDVEVDLFEELSLTLGKPDFIGRTREDLAPGAMFQKFLADASRSVCLRLLDRDRALPPESGERIFFIHAGPRTTFAREPLAVRENMSALLLRFHGVDLPPDSPGLNNWLWLFESAERVSTDPLDVWKTMCVALFTHPDFFTY